MVGLLFLNVFAAGPALAASTPAASPSAVGSTAGGAAGTPSTVGTNGLPRLHAVVLVDESGSERAQDVANEKLAAGVIANASQIDPSSEIGVIGFGTADYDSQDPSHNPQGVTSPNPATDEDCPLTKVGEPDFTSCVAKLHARSVAEGNGTDFASAIDAAFTMLDANRDPSYFNVVFVLTDGGLDVANSPKWGAWVAQADARRQSRDANASAYLTGTLKQHALEDSYQVWPISFGPKPDTAGLSDLVLNPNANPACTGVAVAQPAVNANVGNTDDVWWSLQKVIANATCQGYVPPKPTPCCTHPVTFPLDIPVTASSATITAVKREAGIAITFTDPNGKKVTASGADGTSIYQLRSFTVTGTAETAQSLFIGNPTPGTWTVTFTKSGGGGAPTTVAADLTWLGQLSSVPNLEPVAPKPGEQATVTIKLVTSQGKAVDPKDLAGLRFDAALGGDGFAQTIPVALTDGGQGADRTAGDGTYSGTVTIPKTATGLLALTGTVTGTGLRSTVQNAIYRIAGTQQGGVALSLDQPGKLHHGDTIKGTLQVHNTGTAPEVIKLQPSGLGGLTLTPTTVSVQAGQSINQPVELTVDQDASYGQRTGTVTAVDGQNVTVAEQQLVVKIVKRPGVLQRFAWLIPLIVIALLLTGLAIWLLRRRHRRQVDVAGLVAHVSNGVTTSAVRALGTRWSPEFRFMIDDSQPNVIRLELANPDMAGSPYVARRGDHGRVTVVTPTGESYRESPGTSIPLPRGGWLWIQDTRSGLGATPTGQAIAGAGPIEVPPGWGSGPGQAPAEAAGNPFESGATATVDPFDAATLRPAVPAQPSSVRPRRGRRGRPAPTAPATERPSGGNPFARPNGDGNGYRNGSGGSGPYDSEAPTIQPGQQPYADENPFG